MSPLLRRTNIDATHSGNFARFVNHRCGPTGHPDGPNVALVSVHSLAVPVPAVALFAARDIAPGEEITMSYGPPPNMRPPGGALRVKEGETVGALRGSGRHEEGAVACKEERGGLERCCCGSSFCSGWLPYREQGP